MDPAPETMDDLRRARQGDREALDRLLGRNHARLLQVARARLGNGLRAKIRTSDLLQSTYLDVVRSIPKFDGENSDAFLAWVVQILENNIRDKNKYFGAHKRRQGDVVDAETSSDEQAERLGPGPSTQAEFSEELDRVAEALDGLPDDYRQVIILKMVEGRSHKEMAETLGRSEGATRVLLSRARAALLIEMDRLSSEETEKS